ncbi:MAG: ATP-binding protein, partial [Nitrospirota bacterium]
MPQGGELTVSVSLNVTTVKISVSDTGEGINELDLKSIFMPYFTTKEGGTGLGLCISKRIIEGHKGRLEVESKPGVGTSFIITLPVEGM